MSDDMKALVQDLRNEARCDENEGGFSHGLLTAAADMIERLAALQPAAAAQGAHVALTNGWVHDGDCALNPATGERVPYQFAAPPSVPREPTVEMLAAAKAKDIELCKSNMCLTPERFHGDVWRAMWDAALAAQRA